MEVGRKLKVVIGRDARISGPMIHNLVMNTLLGLGIDVIDLGLSTTPQAFPDNWKQVEVRATLNIEYSPNANKWLGYNPTGD